MIKKQPNRRKISSAPPEFKKILKTNFFKLFELFWYIFRQKIGSEHCDIKIYAYSPLAETRGGGTMLALWKNFFFMSSPTLNIVKRSCLMLWIWLDIFVHFRWSMHFSSSVWEPFKLFWLQIKPKKWCKWKVGWNI